MREIEFRGKRTDNGEWVYGNICNDFYKPKAGIKELWTFIQVINEIGYVYPFDVNPETVGQFTGLKDKNGVKVYQGDVVDVLWYDKGSREPTTNRGVVVWDHRKLAFALNSGKGYFLFSELNIYSDADIEVIGNIHENPELLDSDE